MRQQPFEFIDKYGTKIVMSESSCRCGSCETISIKIIDTDEDPNPTIEYGSAKNENGWIGLEQDENYYNGEQRLAYAFYDVGLNLHRIKNQIEKIDETISEKDAKELLLNLKKIIKDYCV